MTKKIKFIKLQLTHLKFAADPGQVVHDSYPPVRVWQSTDDPLSIYVL